MQYLKRQKNAKFKVMGTRLVKLCIRTGRKWINARLEDTLQFQDVTKNLFVLTVVASREMKVKFTQNVCD